LIESDASRIVKDRIELIYTTPLDDLTTPPAPCDDCIMTSTPIIPTIASTIELINAYAAAIASDSASDSTLDDMQFDIDCILFRDNIPADMIEYADYLELPAFPEFSEHINSIDNIRAYATAAFNLRP
jgi:hypothetical protein